LDLIKRASAGEKKQLWFFWALPNDYSSTGTTRLSMM
jgi:hypothetical protein